MDIGVCVHRARLYLFSPFPQAEDVLDKVLEMEKQLREVELNKVIETQQNKTTNIHQYKGSALSKTVTLRHLSLVSTLSNTILRVLHHSQQGCRESFKPLSSNFPSPSLSLISIRFAPLFFLITYFL